MTDLAEVSDELTKLVSEQDKKDELSLTVCAEYRKLLSQCVKKPTPALVELELMLK